MVNVGFVYFFWGGGVKICRYICIFLFLLNNDLCAISTTLPPFVFVFVFVVVVISDLNHLVL